MSFVEACGWLVVGFLIGGAIQEIATRRLAANLIAESEMALAYVASTRS